MTKIRLRCLVPGSARAVRALAACALSCMAGLAQATADLGVTIQTGNPVPVAGGAAFSYTIVATNHGPGDALTVLVQDPLPADIGGFSIAIVNAPSVAGYGLICAGPTDGNNGTYRCRGTLPAPAGGNNSTATITIVAQVTAPKAIGLHTNTVTISSDTQEASPNTFANSASVNQAVQSDAQVTLSLTATSAVVSGNPVIYLMTLDSHGSSAPLFPVATLNLPAGMRFLGLYGARALHDSCYPTGGGTQVVCRPGVLGLGAHQVTVLAETIPGVIVPGIAQAGATLVMGTGNISGSPASASTNVFLPLLDVDGNQTADALTDGLLLLRYFFGLTGTSLINGVIGPGATRTTAPAVQTYIDTVLPYLDIDGDGTVDALTDGLLIIRYLFGLRGASMANGAVSPDAQRPAAADIETYIGTLLP